MRFTPEAMRALVQAPWEGNVRELKNLVESMVVLTPADEMRVEDLPPEYREPHEPASAESARGGGERAPERPVEAERPLTMDEIERRAILDALDRTSGNRTQAAEMLGIGLRTLQRKLKEYRLAGQDEAE